MQAFKPTEHSWHHNGIAGCLQHNSDVFQDNNAKYYRTDSYWLSYQWVVVETTVNIFHVYFFSVLVGGLLFLFQHRRRRIVVGMCCPCQFWKNYPGTYAACCAYSTKKPSTVLFLKSKLLFLWHPRSSYYSPPQGAKDAKDMDGADNACISVKCHIPPILQCFNCSRSVRELIRPEIYVCVTTLSCTWICL